MQDFSEAAGNVVAEIATTIVVLVVARLVANRIVKKIEARYSN